MKCSKCSANRWKRGSLTGVISDQWTEWQLPHGFCWYILVRLTFFLKPNRTKGNNANEYPLICTKWTQLQVWKHPYISAPLQKVFLTCSWMPFVACERNQLKLGIYFFSPEFNQILSVVVLISLLWLTYLTEQDQEINDSFVLAAIYMLNSC